MSFIFNVRSIAVALVVLSFSASVLAQDGATQDGATQGQSAQDGASLAADVEKLLRFTTDLEAFSAVFEQTVYDANSTPLQTSNGTVSLKRPGRFIWNYEEPSPQTIVADGQKLWLYDKELEQVTVSTIAERASGTPLALLMGESPVDEGFDVKALGPADGIEWYELTPKTADTDFELIFIGLNDAGLAVMELRDSFGQATQILFSDFDDKVNLDDSLFRFTPPAGVDVVGQG